MNPTPTRTTPPRPFHRCPPIAASLLLLASTATLYAQVTPPPDPADPATEEGVIVLDPFRVDTSRDYGYRATNSATGTRLDTPIRDLPLPIEIITEEFFRDIGAVDWKESLQFSAGIIFDSPQASNSFLFSPSGTGQAGQISRDGSALNIRGFTTRRQLRNGFQVESVTDNVNVGRIEVARGPQALLYGVSVLGGVVNIIPKLPSSSPIANLTGSVGSYGFGRFEFDVSGPILSGREGLGRTIGDVGYRLGGSFFTRDNWVEGDSLDRYFIAPSVEWRLFEGTTFLFDLEAADFDQRGRAPSWAASGNSSNRDLTDNVTTPGRRLESGLLVANGADEYGRQPTVLRDVYGEGAGASIYGNDEFRKNKYFNGTAQLTQVIFKDLVAQVAVNQQQQNIRTRSSSASVQRTTTAGESTRPAANANGVPDNSVWTPIGINPFLTGSSRFEWKAIGYGWSYTPQKIDQTQLRGDLTYTFEVGDWLSQSLVAGAQYNRRKTATRSNAQVLRGDGSAGNQTYRPFSDISPIPFMSEDFRPFRDEEFREWNTGYYLVSQTRFLDDRFLAIAGYRWDRYMVRVLNWTWGKVDSTLPDSNIGNWARPSDYDRFTGLSPTGVQLFNNPGANAGSAANNPPGQTPRIEGYRFGGETQKEESPTLGLSFRVIPDVLSIYVTSADGIFPNSGQRDGFNNPLPAEKTRSYEAGIKFDLLKDDDGRPTLSGQAAAFRIERRNAVYNLFWAPSPRNNNNSADSNYPSNLRAANQATFRQNRPEAQNTFNTSRPVTFLVPLTLFQQVGVTAIPGSSPDGTPLANPPAGANVDILGIGTTGRGASALVRVPANLAANPQIQQVLEAGRTNSDAFILQENVGQVSGVSDPTQWLYANHAYESRNSDVPYEDETEGYEIQLIYQPFRNYAATFSYAYLDQGVTGGFNLVSAPGLTGYEPFFSIGGLDNYENNDTGTFSGGDAVIGVRTLDNPEHTASFWNKYTFTDGFLDGFDVGFGVTYQGERQAEQVITNGLAQRSRENARFLPQFAARYVVNLGIGYRREIAGREVTLRLNVNNLLDDRKSEAFGESSLYINPVTGGTSAPGLFFNGTTGAQVTVPAGGTPPAGSVPSQQITVPERAVLYFEPITFRFTVGVRF